MRQSETGVRGRKTKEESGIFLSKASDMISEGNNYFRRGLYDKALDSYLCISLRHPCLSPAIRCNIEICCNRLKNDNRLYGYAQHPRYFRYGHGHSKEHGAIVFDSERVSELTMLRNKKYLDRAQDIKVVFVSDSNISSNKKRKVWGAETSAGYVVKFGRSLGFNVLEVDLLWFDEKAILSADLLVLRSIVRLDSEKQEFLRKVIFERLKPYVTYQHDYSFCKFRNSIKCNGVLGRHACTDCLTPSEDFFCGQIAFYTHLLDKASLNIFISHPQRHIFGEAIGAAIDPSIVILPPVDPEVFKAVDVPRDPKLIVNTSGKLNSQNKGFENISKYIDSNPMFNYELYTEKSPELVSFALNRKNVKIVDPVDNRTLPLVYSRASSLLVMPSVMEPAGRTPIEAALCGCNVISNKKLGVNYFGLPMNDRILVKDLIIKSLNSLWSKLAEIVLK
jgi:hypothetical protein